MPTRLMVSPGLGRGRAVIAVPGSKSDTNRVLIIASLAAGRSFLTNASMSKDSEVLIAGLSRLGISISKSGNTLTIEGGIEKLRPFHGVIDLGAAGTSMRFLTALAALIPNADIILSGSERMHQRPIGELVEALRKLGAKIDYLGLSGCPPLRIHTKAPITAGQTSLSASVSSQFFSALLLVAPLFPNGLIIEVQGEQVSKPYIDLTISAMDNFGVRALNRSYQSYVITPGQLYYAREYQIEGDASGASYFWGLAAISNRTVRVSNLKLDSAQGDLRFPELLARMGCSLKKGMDGTMHWLEVSGPEKLLAIDADLEAMPDVAQTLAVVAACAEGTSRLTGLSTLRHKETDRITALASELEKAGIATEQTENSLIIHGGKPKSAAISTYEDHRMAMSFGMLGSIIPGVIIEEPEVVNKSYPEYWNALRQVGLTIEEAR